MEEMFDLDVGGFCESWDREFEKMFTYPTKYVALEIKKVVFNDPATIVFWEDGTKTVVKCQPGDTYSKELGLAMALVKRFYNNKGSYNDIFRKWAYDD